MFLYQAGDKPRESRRRGNSIAAFPFVDMNTEPLHIKSSDKVE